MDQSRSKIDQNRPKSIKKAIETNQNESKIDQNQPESFKLVKN